MEEGKEYSWDKYRKNPPKYDKKHPQLEFPQIRGNEIVFNDWDSSDRIREVKRELISLTLENISEEDLSWLNSKAKGQVLISSYQGDSPQNYELIRNPKTSQVALRWQGMLMTDPLETLALRFYDGLTREVRRLREALDDHRKGKESGWGDAQVDERLLPSSSQ